MSELEAITSKIISSGKGILAADESTGTMTKRLEDVNVQSNEQNRLKFRNILFSSQAMKNLMNSYVSKFKLKTLIFGEIRICSEKI